MKIKNAHVAVEAGRVVLNSRFVLYAELDHVESRVPSRANVTGDLALLEFGLTTAREPAREEYCR